MSAPTEVQSHDKSSRTISMFAIAISLVSFASSVWTWTLTRPVTYANYTPSMRATAPDMRTNPPATSGPKVSWKAQQKFLATGKAAVKKWGNEHHFGKDVKEARIALAYLCLAGNSTKGGRYYAASLVDDDQFYGIGPYGTRKGDPVKTARVLCASVPSWAQK